MTMLRRLACCLCLTAVAAAWSGAAHAACSSPAGEAGTVSYASNINQMVYCDGTNWVSLGGQPTNLGHVLDDLADVNTAGADAGSVLVYSGGNWIVSNSFGGGGGGSALGDRIVSGSTNITAHQNNSLTFTTAGSQRMIINEHGYVGIGTSNPAHPLHIETGSMGGTGSIYFSDDTSGGFLRLGDGGSAANSFIPLVQGMPGGGASRFMGFYADILATEDTGNTPTVVFMTRRVSSTAAIVNRPLFVWRNNLTDVMSVAPTGNLALGSHFPAAKLDVAGTISASNAIQVGTSALTCTNGISGSIRYNSTQNVMEYCTSTAWVSMGPSATVVPSFKAYRSATQSIADNTTVKVVFNAETFDTNNNFDTSTGTFTPTVPGTYVLTANVNFSSVAANNYTYLYIYKNGSSVAQVVARTGNTADVAGRSVSTIVQANGTTDTFEVHVRHTNGSATNVSAGEGGVTFAGALISMAGGGGGGGGPTALGDLTNVNTAGAVAGSVIRYDGANWVVSDTGSALGDRIISGTHVAVMNETSGYVSLSTGGSTWGYLGSGNSYLPTLVATKVSATNISATYVQLASATTPIACDAGLTGSMRYTSGTMQVCNGTEWGNIGLGVPTGTIAAFATASCPSGWNEYTPARGRFLRGIDPTGTNDSVRAAGNVQADALQNILGSFTSRKTDANNAGIPSTAGAFGKGAEGATVGGLSTGTHYNRETIDFDASRVARTADETRPKNVAVRYCMYAGFESAVATGITTLGGLSDVAVGGAAPGQVLAFDGASWVPSDTTGGGASNLAGLTDVNLTSLAGRDYLRYDAGTSRWVNVSESTVMSTTTVFPGWPDAIVCSSAGFNAVLNNVGRDIATGNMSYRYIASPISTGDSTITFTSSGAYSSSSGLAGFDCEAGTKSIATLYAEGKAYNFIGNNGGGSTALGDRITSGTHAVTVNTASGIVSLTTGSTSWGYLSSGISYLPTLMANRVSATNISTTIVDVMGQVQGNTADAVGAPTYSWTGRTTTGMYSPANNQIGFTTGGAETMRIVGNNVGIGTATPSTSLYINGQIAGGFGAHGTGGVLDFDDISNARSGQGQTLLRGSTASNTPNNTTNYWHPFSFEYNNKLGTGNMTQFAIPYTAASGMYVRFRSSGTWTGWHQFIIADTSGNAVVANNMTAAAFLYSSDERLKQNVKAMTGGLAKVDALNPVTFHYTADAQKRERLGFIAQDVEKVYPQAVATAEDGMKSVDYPSLVPALVGAIKELKAENDKLKASQVDMLKRLEALEAKQALVR